MIGSPELTGLIFSPFLLQRHTKDKKHIQLQ